MRVVVDGYEEVTVSVAMKFEAARVRVYFLSGQILRPEASGLGYILSSPFIAILSLFLWRVLQKQQIPEKCLHIAIEIRDPIERSGIIQVFNLEDCYQVKPYQQSQCVISNLPQSSQSLTRWQPDQA